MLINTTYNLQSKMAKHRAHAAIRMTQDVVTTSEALLRSHDEDEFAVSSMKRLSTRDRFRSVCNEYISDLDRWICRLERKEDDPPPHIVPQG
jgi:hypothetical protein